MQKVCPSCKGAFAGGEIFCPNDGTRLSTPSQLAGVEVDASARDQLVGTTVDDRYRILRRIGEGGMGIVYEAEHRTLEKRVALKVLRDDYSSRPEVVERFRQEAKSASRIGNAHIVDISDFGELPTRASYFVMELLSGEDLSSLLQREQALPVERAADILFQCCKALSAAHQKGIVHRDMKPENIFLTERDGRADFVKIVDFGIAKMSDVETSGPPGRKLTKTGMIFGTPEYMSPEQAAGKPLDHRVDIYALGVIFYEMLSGRVPFLGDSFMAVLTQHMFEPVPPVSSVNPSVTLEPAIEAFLAKAMAKDAEARFATCDDVGVALEAALRGETTFEPAPPGGPGRTLYGHADLAKARARPVAVARESKPTLAEGDLVAAAPPARSSAARGAGIAIAALALALGGAYFAFGRGGSTGEGDVSGSGGVSGGAAVAAALDAGVVAALVAPADAGPPDAPAPVVPVAEAALDAGGPPRVVVSVETTPAGATVTVDDRGEVCDSTPCTFEAPADQPLHLRAARGRARAEADVTPTEGMAPVTLRLVARAPTPGEPTSGSGTSSGGRGGTRGAGDLKIPDIFARPRTP